MTRNNYFQFKQFLIIQEKSAMKVGTDGVLLGAWVNVQNEREILDVGTGTGLIALMMAQRTSAQITGIEIEKNAVEEASNNCNGSPWSDRLLIENISFQKFTEKSNKEFDLVITNPPFFVNDKKSKDDNLAIAKHNDLLSIEDILNGSQKLLNPRGKLALILPVIQAEELIQKAKSLGLHLIRLTKVKPTPGKETNRYLMEFSKKNKELKNDSLTILNKDGSNFSASYITLTKDFYLNF